jgi:hypothetical protein
VPLSGGFGSILGRPKGIAFIVLGLKMVPATELILYLNFDASHDCPTCYCQYALDGGLGQQVTHLSEWPWIIRMLHSSLRVWPRCAKIKGHRPTPLGSVLPIIVALLAGASLTLILLSWCGSWYVQQRYLRLAKVFQRELMRRSLLTPDILGT